MANWITNYVVIHGNIDELNKFYSEIKTLPINGETTLFNLYSKLGYSNDELETFKYNGRLDEINIVEPNHYCDETVVTIDSCVPNGVIYEDITRVMAEKYPGLTAELSASEQGLDLFINTDDSGKYIKAHYYLVEVLPKEYLEKNNIPDVWEYFDSLHSLVDRLTRIFPDMTRNEILKFADIQEGETFMLPLPQVSDNQEEDSSSYAYIVRSVGPPKN